MKIYVYKDDQQMGPYSEEQIQAFLREHMLDTGDLAWADGWASYVPIEDVADLMVGATDGGLGHENGIIGQKEYRR